jgi:hypothetical protein
MILVTSLCLNLYNTSLQERKAKILNDSSILAKGVDGGFIAPDSLLQEVDALFLHVYLFFVHKFLC